MPGLARPFCDSATAQQYEAIFTLMCMEKRYKDHFEHSNLWPLSTVRGAAAGDNSQAAAGTDLLV